MGVRKVLGSSRQQLFWLFITETSLIVGISLGIALMAITLCLPWLNVWVQTRLSLQQWTDPMAIFFMLLLLSKDYIRMILIAFLIVMPISNYFMSDWLQNFAYRIAISWWMFAFPGLLVLLIALLSVSGQTVKAARQNPVDSLRNE